jgi:hypothetical protein
MDASPVANEIEPLLPRLVVPELRLRAPLMPLEPEFAV